MIAEQTDFTLKKWLSIELAFVSLAFSTLVVPTYLVGSTFGYTAAIWLVAIISGLLLVGVSVYQKCTEQGLQLQHFDKMQAKSKTDLFDAVSLNNSSAAFIENIGTSLLESSTAVCDAAEFLNFRSRVNENQNDGQDIETALLGNANKLYELGSDIVEFSNLSKGKFALTEQEIDPVELIKACVSIVNNKYPAGQSVAIEPMKNSRLLISGDLAKLKVLLTKLIASAVSHVLAAGGYDPVKISLQVNDKGLMISVKMAGYHLTDNRFNQLCSPLQNHKGLHRDNDCDEFDLKLAIARKLAQLHDGDISISDQSPSGTILAVCLPAKRMVKIALGSNSPTG